MKNLLLAFALFLTYQCTIAQDQKLAKNGLPLNAKIINIESLDSTGKLFESVAQMLFDQGYPIKSSDKNTGIIQTDNKNVKGGWYVRLSFAIMDNKVRIRGNLHIPRLEDGVIENYGMRGSFMIMAFSEMDRVAKLLPYTTISYSK